MTNTYAFLETGAKWTNSEIENLQFSIPTSDPSYYLDPLAAVDLALHFVPYTKSQLTSDPNPDNIDQQDIVRFLLDDPGTQETYFGSNAINATLIETTNTIGENGIENYRVYFSDVINSNFSEIIEWRYSNYRSAGIQCPVFKHRLYS